jgi:hypothetical protein
MTTRQLELADKVSQHPLCKCSADMLLSHGCKDHSCQRLFVRRCCRRTAFKYPACLHCRDHPELSEALCEEMMTRQLELADKVSPPRPHLHC